MGDEAGLTLMEMLPPVGWADVATKDDLVLTRSQLTREIDAVRNDIGVVRTEMNGLRTEMNLKFDAIEDKLMGAFHKEMTAQTWRLITGATGMFALFAVVARI